MASNYQIQIKAVLDKSQIISDIQDLQKSADIKPIELKVSMSGDGAKIFAQLQSELNNFRANSKVDLNVNTSGLDVAKESTKMINGELKETSSTTKSLGTSFNTITKEVTKFGQEETKIVTTTKDYESASKALTSANEKYANILTKTEANLNSSNLTEKQTLELRQQLQSVEAMPDKTADDIKKKTSAMSDLNVKIKEQALANKNNLLSWDSIAQSMKIALVRIAEWGVSTAIIYGSIRKIKEAVGEVKEMDKALTEYQKVSDLSGGALDEFVKKAQNAGNDIAKTGKEMISAATKFKKSGFTDEDSLILSRVSGMYQNVADDEISAGDAASFIISQMKAFGIESENSEHIIDALNEVSNKYAVSSSDLSDNIGKVSATMAEGNTTYEQTLGLISATVEITRDAAKASTALKTIGQRLRGVSEDGEDISSKLQPALESAGIKIDIVNEKTGEMASTWEILSAIAAKWDDLTEAQRQNLGELAAGKNRITEFNALMSNFDTAINATSDAMNSMGSASKENAKYVDSIEGKTKALSKEFEKLALQTISSDFIKSMIEAGTVVLQFINAIGGIGPILTVIAPMLISTFGPKLLSAIKAVLIPTNAFQILLTAMAAAIAIVVGSINAYNQSIEKMNQETRDAADAAKKEIDSIQSLISKYKELSSSVEIDSSKREEIKSLQEKIVGLVGKEADGLDLVNGKLSDNSEQLRKILVQKAAENKIALENAKILAQSEASRKPTGVWKEAKYKYSEAPKLMDQSVSSLFKVDEFTSSIAKSDELMKKYGEDIATAGSGFETFLLSGKSAYEIVPILTEINDEFIKLRDAGDKSEGLTIAISRVGTALEYWKNLIKEAEGASEDLVSNDALINYYSDARTSSINTQEALFDYINSVRNASETTEGFNDALVALAISENSNLVPSFFKGVQSIDDFDKALNTLNLQKTIQGNEELKNTFSEITDSDLNNWSSEQINSLLDLYDTMKLSGESVDQFVGRLKSIGAVSFKHVLSGMQSLTEAVDQYNAAKETEDTDVFYKTYQDANKTLKEAQKSGKQFVDQVKESAELILGEGALDNLGYDEYIAKLKEAGKLYEKYFTEDSAKGASRFVKDLQKKNLAKYDKKTKQVKLEEGITAKDIADSLGLSESAVSSLFGELETRGWTVDWAELFPEMTEEEAKNFGAGSADLLSEQTKIIVDQATKDAEAINQSAEEVEKAKKRLLDAYNLTSEPEGETTTPTKTNVPKETETPVQNVPVTVSVQLDQLELSAIKQAIEATTGTITILTNASEITTEVESVKTALSQIPPDTSIKITLDDGASVSDTGEIVGNLNKISLGSVLNIDASTDDAKSKLEDLNTIINTEETKPVDVNIDGATSKLNDLDININNSGTKIIDAETEKALSKVEELDKEATKPATKIVTVKEQREPEKKYETKKVYTGGQEYGSVSETGRGDLSGKSIEISAELNDDEIYSELDKIESSDTIVYIDADTKEALDRAKKLANNISNMNPELVVGVRFSMGGSASGTKNAKKSLTSVDEEGMEAIFRKKKGVMEFGNNNGARITALEDGDIVYNAKETKEMFNRQPSMSFEANADAQSKETSGPPISGGGGNDGGGGSGSGGGRNSSRKKKKKYGKEQFEKDLEELRHMLAMNEITEEEYTNRLEKLYKKAFEGKKKFQEDYNKYEEEVYERRKEIAQGTINLVQSEIDILDKEDPSYYEKKNELLDEQIKAQDELIDLAKKQNRPQEEINQLIAERNNMVEEQNGLALEQYENEKNLLDLQKQLIQEDDFASKQQNIQNSLAKVREAIANKSYTTEEERLNLLIEQKQLEEDLSNLDDEAYEKRKNLLDLEKNLLDTNDFVGRKQNLQNSLLNTQDALANGVYDTEEERLQLLAEQQQIQEELENLDDEELEYKQNILDLQRQLLDENDFAGKQQSLQNSLLNVQDAIANKVYDTEEERLQLLIQEKQFREELAKIDNEAYESAKKLLELKNQLIKDDQFEFKLGNLNKQLALVQEAIANRVYDTEEERLEFLIEEQDLKEQIANIDDDAYEKAKNLLDLQGQLLDDEDYKARISKEQEKLTLVEKALSDKIYDSEEERLELEIERKKILEDIQSIEDEMLDNRKKAIRVYKEGLGFVWMTQEQINEEKSKKSYANGGIIDYTGMANVHGSPSSPEIALNNSQAGWLFNFINSLSNPVSWIKDKISNGKQAINYTFENVNITANEPEDFFNGLKQYAFTHS